MMQHSCWSHAVHGLLGREEKPKRMLRDYRVSYLLCVRALMQRQSAVHICASVSGWGTAMASHGYCLTIGSVLVNRELSAIVMQHMGWIHVGWLHC